MSRKSRSRRRLTATVVLLAVVTAAGAAWAASGVKLKLTGPSGVTLKHDTPFMVTVSGTASSQAATRLFAFQGGQVRGGTAAIQCYSTEQSEWARYKPSPTVHVFLGRYPVSGRFSHSWRFYAVHPGPRSFCAYLASPTGSTTYAQAALHWTNQP